MSPKRKKLLDQDWIEQRSDLGTHIRIEKNGEVIEDIVGLLVRILLGHLG